MNKVIPILLLLVLSSFTYARKYTHNEANKLFPGSEVVLTDDNTGALKFIKLKKDNLIPVEDGVVWLKKIFNSSPSEEFKLVNSEKDQHGYTHFRYQQVIYGIPVEDGIFYLHSKGGLIVSANGEYYLNIRLDSRSESITKTEAIKIAKSSIIGNKNKWNDHLVSSPKKVVCSLGNGRSVLAFKTDIYSAEPLVRKYIYVDAVSGNIIRERNRIHHADVIGTAHTKYNGVRDITTDSFGGSFRLRESGRGNGVNTFDLNTSFVHSDGIDFVDNDNVWNTTTNQDDAAYDAHFGTEATYDYFLNTYGRNSYDNNGAALNSYVHYGQSYTNAFWDGTQMTYGDGDGIDYTALTSLDVVGHEITHALTEHSAGLIYAGESGALNESFSDIFGVVVDFYKNPGTANYLMGDEFAVSGNPFRNMGNPNQYNHPDTYNGLYWTAGGGVHTNSGVQNYWFYLLANGGSGINDIGNNFNVTGIGITSAAAIAYRNLTTYLTPNSTYADARFFAIQAAEDLFGACSAEVVATTDAWHAVGIGGVFSNSVQAAFASDVTHGCNVPSTINFTSNSTNASVYFWDFGDGDTSNLANPSHTYTSAGTYTVTLIVNGIASCGGSEDTMTQTNYITITNTGGPISAACSPVTTNAGTFGMGIFNFSFSTINNGSGGGVEGYEDFSCSQTTTVTEGNLYHLDITTGTTYSEDVRMWIDLNNDGQFNMTNELIFASNNALQSHTADIITPGGAVHNTPLRMRVASDFESYDFTNSCNSITNGQAEDYSITFLQNSNPPVANFIANHTTVNVGQIVNFTDLSLNVPTSWDWEFQGATPSSSNVANPSVFYNATGTYTVTLRVSNSFGSDTLVRVGFVTVVNHTNMCSGQDSTNASSGIIYDSGGPTANYSNSENCSFLINPACASSVTLTFNALDIENGWDFLTIYDGNDNTGVLLTSLTGTTLPPPVVANSGSMYLEFSSDGIITRSGFEASWTSVIPTSLPNAGMTLSDHNPPIHTSVQFTDVTTNFPNFWQWDFGDGNFSSQQHPSHTYTNSGTYTITLVSNNCFASDTAFDTLTVQQPPLIQVIPDSFDLLVSCGDSLQDVLNIINIGNGDLVYNINGTNNSNGNVELLALTYGVDYLEEYTNTLAALNQYFTNYNLTETNSSDPMVLQTSLIGKDVLLIPEKENGLNSVFTDFAPVLQNFVTNGGTVIFCGSAFGNEQSIFNTGLFSGSFGQDAFTNTLTVVDNTHDITSGFPSTIPGDNGTYTLNLTNSDVVTLVDYNGFDAISYRPIGSGNAVFIAYDYFQYNNFAAEALANAVQWGAQGNLSNWISILQSNDTVTSGDTSTIDININASNLYAGVYQDTIAIYSNDTTNNPLFVPVQLTVSGQPLIHVVPDSIQFGQVQVGGTASDTLFISNNGCDTLDITSLLSTDLSFSTSTGGLQIPPFANDTVFIFFSPDNIELYLNDTIFINNNDSTKFVIVEGEGIGAPVISYNPLSINETIISCNDSVTIPITLYNTGQGPLTSTINISNVSSGSNNFYDDFESGTLTNWTDEGGTYVKQITSFDPGAGSYSLEFIDGQSVHMDGLSSTFPGSTPSEVSFKLKSSSTVEYGSFILIGDNPVGAFADALLYLFMSNDGRFYINGNYYSSYVANQWVTVELKNINWTTKTTDLYLDGILEVPALSFQDVFISEVNTVHLYSWGSNNTCYFDDIRIGDFPLPGWINTSEDSLNVSIGDSSTFFVTLYSEDLSAGTYDTEIIINSNDPVSPFDTIPVTLTVEGTPQIALSDTCIEFGSIIENNTVWDSLTIHNTGCDTLSITNITSGIPEFSSSISNLNILPGDSGKIPVSFSPTSAGNFSSQLVILNNDRDTSICLNGVSTGAPIISYSPTTINETIGSCNDSITIPITIYNTGQTVLSSSINILSNGSSGSNFYDGFEIGNLSNWTDDGGAYTKQITTVNPGSGSYALELIGGQSVHKDGVSRSLNNVTPEKISFRLKSTSANDYGSFVLIGDNPSPWFNSLLYMFMNNNGTYYVNGSYLSNFSANTWSLIELKNIDWVLKTFDFYVDGILEASSLFFEDQNISQLNSVHLYSWSNFNSCYFDDIHIGDGVDWINSSNNNLTTNISDSSTFFVTLYSSGLSSGTHTANIVINSNDPLSPVDTIPVTFTIPIDPCTDFSYEIPGSCSRTVNFMDETTNNPTIWQWDFGDGNLSTVQNPSHTYSSNGNYNVQLTACNSSSCSSINYFVNVSSAGGPASAFCEPTTTLPSVFLGIFNFTFSTINNTSSGSIDGYSDYSCTLSTSLTEGNNYNVSVTTSASSFEDVRVWIDFNGDGQFDNNNELVFISDNVLQNHTGNINIPTGIALLNTSLRLRVASEWATNDIATSCSNVAYGQYEDYAVIIQTSTSPPFANFATNVLDHCQGVVQFTDASTNSPTSWLWDFGDGNTSTVQNPFHTYTLAGLYTVTLTVSNNFGSTFSTQTFNINYLNASINVLSPLVVNQPINFSANAPGANSWLWDFGDGNSSSISSPTHTYTNQGVYVVTLTTSNTIGCNSVAYDTLDINSTSIDEYSNNITIFPNPSDGMIYILNNSSHNIERIMIHNTIGKRIYQFENNQNTFHSKKIQLGEVSTGIYYIKVMYEGHKPITKKFIVQR